METLWPEPIKIDVLTTGSVLDSLKKKRGRPKLDLGGGGSETYKGNRGSRKWFSATRGCQLCALTAVPGGLRCYDHGGVR